jgi:DNA-binding PadR family transcriptional regulator
VFFGKRFSGHEGGIFSGLDILVLSIIENYDGISGYDLARKINEKFNKLWNASPGPIYPLLNR